jgi:membrane protein required for colicin V production
MSLLSTLNWYDWVVAVAVVYGLWSGLRTGLSGELLRVLSWVLMVAAAVFFFEPVGAWLARTLRLAREPANLIAFVVLVVMVYVIMLAIRWLVTKRFPRQPMAAFLENFGGALAGALRMTVMMGLLTVVLCLTRSAWWHTQVGKNSRFGAGVIHYLPAVEAMTRKQFDEKVWFLKDVKRRDEPDYLGDSPAAKP